MKGVRWAKIARDYIKIALKYSLSVALVKICYENEKCTVEMEV
jgi:hypothetical protein